MDTPEAKIESIILRVGQRWRWREVSWCAALIAACVPAWLLVMVLVDNLAILSRGQLLLGWGVLAAAACALALWLGRRVLLRHPDADALALMYESHFPGVQNRLINAVQFLVSEQAGQDPVARAAVIENAERLDEAAARQAVPLTAVRRALAGVGIGAVLLLAYVALRPAWAGNALSRLAHPLHPGAHLLSTDPQVTPGDTQVVEGQPLTIRAQVPKSLVGREATDVRIEYRIGTLDWARSPMSAGAAGAYAWDFPAVRQTIDYRVRADRSVSKTYHVSVQYRPRVEHLQVKVTRPAYAGGSTRELKPDAGDITALAGSTIDVQLTASVPLARGRIVLDNTRAPLRISRDEKRTATAKFTLMRSGSYAIELTDTAGLRSLNPPRFSLTAEPDSPPVAVVTRPGRDLILPLNSGLPLTIEAEDDIGLAAIVLQTRSAGGDWKDAQSWDMPELNTRHRTIEASLPLKDRGLKVGDMLLYRAIASDHRAPQPNVGIGRTWSITLAEASEDPALLAAQARHLLEALRQILALQRENRAELDMDRPEEPIRGRQDQVRQLTAAVIDQQHKALRPTQSVIDELVALSDGPMLRSIEALRGYGGTYQQRIPLKAPILKLMDEIIARLEALIAKVEQSLASAEKAQKLLEKLGPEDREQALKRVRDLISKLRTFLPEQDKVIDKTEELVRKGENLTDNDLKTIEKLKGTEDKWDSVFTDSVTDIGKLTEQGFADRTIADDYKQMVEQIEEASKNLHPKLIELAVPREQSGRELASSLAEEMEMWLPNSPDHVKWMMEEPLDRPDIPMPELPDQLSDLIGDLIEQQDELNDAAEDMTSSWADSISAAGWEAADGPISNFSAVGKTGNQLPDNQELSGRSGDGRSGRAQGQLVGDVARGLPGRKTPTRVTNDPYEQGVVKELQQMATGGATGGGKARGAGQEGLQGSSPPPVMEQMQFMRDWQQRIRQQAEKVAGQLQKVRVPGEPLNKSIGLMKQAEKAAGDGRYRDLFKIQQMVLQNLKMAGDLAAREVSLNVDRAYHLPPEQRKQILEGLDEPVPQEYEDAVRRYFEQLSETK